MSWTHILNSCNNYINGTVLYEKILLYLVPLFVVTVVYFNFQKETFNNKISDNKINVLKNKIDSIKKRINKKPNLINILKNIEKFALKNSINILKVKRNDETLEIFFKSTSKNLLTFINYCENFNSYSKIRTLNITKDNDKLLNSVQLILSFKTFHIKKKIVNLRLPIINSLVEKKYHLNAIIGNNALIDNQWFSKNQNFYDFKIIKITQNSVVLKNKNKKLILELFPHEPK